MNALPNPTFWRGRRVFVTGHTGFKGSWLSLWLASLGAKVTGYALAPPTDPSLFALANVARKIESIQGDIRDYERLKGALSDGRPEVILHLAAQSIVRRSYHDPIETYSSNVLGTVHLLEAVRQLGNPCAVVNVTSDKCYENREWPWGYRESDRLGGHDPYSNSKACAELVMSAYCDSFFHAKSVEKPEIVVASARAGNVIGGGDWTADQLLPDLIRSFIQDSPCLIRSPGAVRPWQFVLEPLRGYLILAERLTDRQVKSGSGWNFGPADDDAKPVSWIAEQLVKLWGGTAGWKTDHANHPREANLLRLEISKARNHLEWSPSIPLALALEWVVGWYRTYQSGGDLEVYTLKQIGEYEARFGNSVRPATGIA